MSAIPDQLLAELKDCVAQRRISDGLALLDAHAALFDSFDAFSRNAPAFLGYLAQWVDIGYRDSGLVKRLLAYYGKESRSGLPLSSYAHLRMAEAMLSMSEEEAEAAIGHLNVVLTLADDVNDLELVAIAHYWKARCQRKRGEYDHALRPESAGAETVEVRANGPSGGAILRLEVRPQCKYRSRDHYPYSLNHRTPPCCVSSVLFLAARSPYDCLSCNSAVARSGT